MLQPAALLLCLFLPALTSGTERETCHGTCPSEEFGDISEASGWEGRSLEIERRSMSVEEFIQKYDGKWPVVLTDAMGN